MGLGRLLPSECEGPIPARISLAWSLIILRSGFRTPYQSLSGNDGGSSVKVCGPMSNELNEQMGWGWSPYSKNTDR